MKIIIGTFWGKKRAGGRDRGGAAVSRRDGAGGGEEDAAGGYAGERLRLCVRGRGGFRDAAAPVGVRVEKEYRGEELNIRDLSGNRTLVRFGAGDEVTVQAGPEGVRFLLVAGRPLKEPVAWQGPIVMNTREELETAMNELRNGSFIKGAA